jgi:hypothetical protein
MGTILWLCAEVKQSAFVRICWYLKKNIERNTMWEIQKAKTLEVTNS